MNEPANENLFINVAEFYDLDPRNIVKNDIPFYIEYAGKAVDKTVLELACGTGRVSIPLASRGFHVTGLDLSPSMLTVFERKLLEKPEIKENITIVKADMSAFSLEKQFGLIIIPFRAFQSLTSDESALSCLKCAKEHLAAGGMFIIDVFEPYKRMDESWIYPEKVQWEMDDPATGCKYTKLDEGYKIDVESQVIYVKQTYIEEHPDGDVREYPDYLKLRYYYYDQIAALIKESGLVVKESYGFYDKSPVSGGREIIFICSK